MNDQSARMRYCTNSVSGWLFECLRKLKTAFTLTVVYRLIRLLTTISCSRMNIMEVCRCDLSSKNGSVSLACSRHRTQFKRMEIIETQLCMGSLSQQALHKPWSRSIRMWTRDYRFGLPGSWGKSYLWTRLISIAK